MYVLSNYFCFSRVFVLSRKNVLQVNKQIIVNCLIAIFWLKLWCLLTFQWKSADICLIPFHYVFWFPGLSWSPHLGYLGRNVTAPLNASLSLSPPPYPPRPNKKENSKFCFWWRYFVTFLIFWVIFLSFGIEKLL